MIKELRGLGLSFYESKIVGELLMQRLSMKELSRKAKIPYGKIFSICNALKDNGIIDFTNERPKKAYIENASLILGNLIEKRQKEHDMDISHIKEIVASVEASKFRQSKFFEIGTTIEENKRVQLRSFVEAENEVCQMLNKHHKPHSNRGNKLLWEKEIINAVNRGVIFRSIYHPDSALPKILALLNKKYPEKFCVRRLDVDFIRCDIIDSKKVLIKLVHKDPINFGGVLFIEDNRLARHLHNVFENFWEEASNN